MDRRRIFLQCPEIETTGIIKTNGQRSQERASHGTLCGQYQSCYQIVLSLPVATIAIRVKLGSMTKEIWEKSGSILKLKAKRTSWWSKFVDLDVKIKHL